MDPSLKEGIMVSWTLGIALGAIFSAILLNLEVGREWSERKIFFVSILSSGIVVGTLLLSLKLF